MKKSHYIPFLLVFFLTGCWDQHSLKDSALVLSIAMDQAPKNHIKTTAIIRTSVSKGGETEAINYVAKEEGFSVRDARHKIDYQIPGNFSSNKLLVMLLGEDLAKKNLYPYFDNFFRYIRSSLSSRVVIVKGQASSILEMKTYKDILIGESLLEMIESAENLSLIPKETQESIYKKMADPGYDLVLPYLEKIDDETLKIKGVGLLQNNKFTGKILNEYQSKLLLLLQDNKGTAMSFSEKINEKNEVVSFKVKNENRRLKTKIVNGQPKVNIDIKIKIDLNEYTGGTLASDKKKKEIEKKLTKKMENEMIEVIHILQEANCDALGIGRFLMAYHPKTWAKLNWEKEYSKVPFNITNKVIMTTRGIMF
ncbi:Ger(x)C family spore germination protein [Bacillus sp. AFS041924]|uniref:Ger(x)C family spore germination protein n=1 Tax=Bacillus sp. AFS041924 TaxID=2033503 RepID=UPI000BFCC797|nr:Ger(x)C family spore germination protein [Bacillus sp. AFS041924]PGS46604.1 hypothetical protein COC46_20855 [Bacillus sp. AFS041924]